MTTAQSVWATIGGAWALQPEAYVQALRLPYAGVLALAVVLCAGLSEAVGQCVVLFANKVKPARFVFSLLIQAILFVFGYAFLVISTWAVGLLPLAQRVPIGAAALGIALSYAPLLFAFLRATVPGCVLWALRVWHLLAMVVSFAAVTGISYASGPLYVGLGWLVLIVAQHTFGKPIAQLGAFVAKAVAGVELRDYEIPISTASFAVSSQGSPAQPSPAQPVAATVTTGGRSRSSAVVATVLGVALVVVLVLAISAALSPLRHSAFGWYDAVPGPLRLPFRLMWVGVIGILVAGFMAPLETLGWYARLVRRRICSTRPGAIERARSTAVRRYVVYLDGICQSSSPYTAGRRGHFSTRSHRVARRRAARARRHVVLRLQPAARPRPAVRGFWSFIDGPLRQPAEPARHDRQFAQRLHRRRLGRQALRPDVQLRDRATGLRRPGPNGYRREQRHPRHALGYSGGGQMSSASAASSHARPTPRSTSSPSAA